MAAITVLNKDNVPTGPFTEAQVAEKLATGEFTVESLAFVEGLSQWTPLREVLARVGAPAIPAAASVPSAPVGSIPAYSYAATMQPPGHLVYAGFWIRVAAYLIDGFIIGIPLGVVICILFGIVGGAAYMMGGLSHSTDNGANTLNPVFGIGFALTEMVLWVLSIGISWLYFAKLESGSAQATYGKRVMGLKVTDIAGNRISFGHASGRFFGKIVSGMTFYIGFMMAGFTEKKQALHDLIAGTLVIKSR